MTKIDDKFEQISKENAAADKNDPAVAKRAAFWSTLEENARDMLAPYGWESEPAPTTWKGQILEAFGDAGSAYAGGTLPPRSIREQARQDIKGTAIKLYEEAVKTGNYPKPKM